MSSATLGQTQQTITIPARGAAVLTPVSVEARFQVSASAETAKQALEDLKKKCKAALDAIKKIPDATFTVTEIRLSANDGTNNNPNVQVRAIGGKKVWLGANNTRGGGASKFSAERTLVVAVEQLKGKSAAARIEAVADLLEKAKELGLSVVPGLDKLAHLSGRVYSRGSSSSNHDNGGPFSFIGDREAAQKAAQKAALDDARQKAELLATLAGRKLGPLSTLRVTRTTPPSDKLADGGLFVVQMRVVFTLE